MRNVFIMYVLILIVLFFCFQNLKPDLNINQTKQEPNITKVIFINNSDEKEIARLNQKIENQQNIIDSLRYNLSELMLSKQKNPNNYRGLYNFTNNKIEIFCNQAPQRVLSTCVHEVGHYIQDEYFFYNDFKEYQEIIKKENNMISNYANTNIYEDFAENYRAIVIISYNFSKIPPLRSEYFRKKLKLRGVI